MANVSTMEMPAVAAGASRTTDLEVDGMTCGNCARHVTEAIQSVAGVHSAVVSLDSHQARVRWQPGKEDQLPAVLDAVKEAGFEARAVTEHSHADHHGILAGWGINLWVGLCGTIPLMLGEWVFGLASVSWFRWASFIVASVVQVLAGARFYRGAWSQLKVRGSNMDTLVSLGSTTAFAYSTWVLFSGGHQHLYFMEAASIITLISVGHWVEARMSVRASDALKNLLHLAPEQATRRDPTGREVVVPILALRKDDEVVARPGDRIPTDAVVFEGESAVDESMLTGESIPVDKSPGQEVYAGTVNLNGRLVLRVTATGEETALAHIIAAVQRAQTSRANIQRLGDRISNVFVPIVVTVALLAGLWWGLAPEWAAAVHSKLAVFLWHADLPGGFAASILVVTAVLIIACPCAMGLATPAAIMAGANVAAKRGILIRDGVALEKAGYVTAVLFDKTGTLTRGKPEVVQVAAISDQGVQPIVLPGAQSPLLNDAAALASGSSHPVSQALSGLSTRPSRVAEWQELRGSGVQAKDLETGALLRLGSLSWLTNAGVGLGDAQPFVDRWTAEGATIVGLARGGALEGLFALKDALKPGAASVLEQLRSSGLRIFLITGDHARTAASLARELGIASDNVFAEVRPEQKAELVKSLQQRGERVAFVGDGINDAPALEQADLGIAVSRASDIAREAADIILLKSEIEAVPESIGLARATLKTIKQNLFWAFFYNGIGIPLAALGFMSPILCAAAMGVSDLVVIGNALRLARWKMAPVKQLV